MSLQTHRSHAGPVAIRPVLAPHLQEIVESLAAGETAREAAARLFISPNTVKSRLKALYQQLGARDQAHAVAIAFRLGILRTTADEPNLQPVVIGGLNPDRLRTTINDLTALLRIAEKVPRTDYQDLLREVADLAADPDADPHATLQEIARIAESAGGGVAGEPAPTGGDAIPADRHTSRNTPATDRPTTGSTPAADRPATGNTSGRSAGGGSPGRSTGGGSPVAAA